MKMKLRTTVFAAALLLVAGACFAGVNKTGGVYEVTADVISAGGFGTGTGALFTIYNAFGQQTGYYTQGTGGNFTVMGGIIAAVTEDDTTPPSDISAVNDGTGSDVDYATSTDRLSANWTASSDGESGIAGYWIAVGSTAGATDTLDWLNAGDITATTVLGITLTDGNTYYFSVKAENGAGLMSGVASSDGVTIAATMPMSTVTSPANGASLNSLVLISGTATDGSGAGLARVDVSIARLTDGNFWDGAAWTVGETWLAASGTVSWTFFTGLPAWENGVSYTIKSRATDNAMNEEIPGAGNSFTYDTGVAVAITSPVADAMLNAAQVVVSGTTETGSTVTVNGVSATVTGTSFTATITLAAQGANTITANVSDTAGNTGSNSVTVSLDSVAPAAAITSPADSGIVTGSLTVTGTAADANFSSMALEYGPGASPTLWKTIASSTSPVTAATLGTADMSSLAGSYTIRLTVTDTYGNTSSDSVSITVSGNTISKEITVVEEWQLISISMDIADAAQKEILADKKLRFYRWDPYAEQLPGAGRYRVPTTLPAGMGLWVSVKLKGAEEALLLTGSPVDTTRDYDYTLGTGWNQIGPPFPWQVSWANVEVRSGGQVYDIAAAASMSIVESTPFYFDGEGWRQLTESSVAALAPGTGYFLYAPGSDVTLVYNPGAEDSSGVARIVKRGRDFSMKISARSGGATDVDNIIALANDFRDDYDGHDLREPPGAMGEYVSLYFPHDDWGGNAGRYTNDFRRTVGLEESCRAEMGIVTCKTWDFTVETGAVSRVSLSWDDLSAYSERFDVTLKDLAGGDEVDMLSGTSREFQSAGTAGKNFRITLKGRPPVLKTISYTLHRGWNLVSIPVEAVVTDAEQQLGDDLPGTWVYQYYDGELFSVNDEEGVDLQAGVGYWIFSEGDTVIDVEGYDVNPALPPSVLLKKGWNFIGNPYGEPLAWGDNISVTCGASAMTLGAAVADGWIGSTVFSYGDDGKYAALPPGGTLVQWAGYLVQSSGDCWIELKK